MTQDSKDQSNPAIIIYTDGSCLRPNGPGGWGALIFDGDNVRELGGRLDATTNNRSELTAAIRALENCEPNRPVHVFADSQYLTNGATYWLERWLRNNGFRKDLKGYKREVKNMDLWLQLYELLQRSDAKFFWVKGHSGNAGNERADAIASAFGQNGNANLHVGALRDAPTHDYLIAIESGKSKALGKKLNSLKRSLAVGIVETKPCAVAKPKKRRHRTGKKREKLIRREIAGERFERLMRSRSAEIRTVPQPQPNIRPTKTIRRCRDAR